MTTEMFREMDEGSYHARTFITSHKLASFIRCPRLFIQKYLGVDIPVSSKSVEGMRLGSAVHTLVLSGEDAFHQKYTTDACDADRVVLKPEDYALCFRMRDAVLHNEAAKALMRQCQHIETVFAKEIAGIQCQSRIDMVSSDGTCIVDLKTISNLNYSHDLSLDYMIQAAFYIMMMRELLNADARFHFLFVEKEAPHRVDVITFQDKDKYVPMVYHALASLKALLDLWPDDPTKWPELYVYEGSA